MKTNEQGSRRQRTDVGIAVAQLRKQLLTMILQGNMTPEEETVYYAWRKGLETTL
jgi:hypothetical protein